MAALVGPSATGAHAATASTAPQPKPRYLYVADESGTVTEVDTQTFTTVGSVTLPAAVDSIAVSPNGSAAYVTDGAHNQVFVISTTTNAVLATIKTGALPASIGFSPTGADAYVYNELDGTFTVIDTATLTVAATIPVPAAQQSGSYGTYMAVSPLGGRAMVSLEDGTVLDVSLTTGAASAAINLGVAGWQGVYSPNGKRFYAAYLASTYAPGSVAVINTATDKVTHTITTNGPRPGSIAVSLNGETLYTADFLDSLVDEISTTTYAVTGELEQPTGSYPIAVAASDDYVFAADGDSNEVAGWSVLQNGTPTGSILNTTQPVALAFVPES